MMSTKTSVVKGTVPVVAGGIAIVLGTYLPHKPYTAELHTVGVGVAGALAGAWLGVHQDYPRYMQWIGYHVAPLPLAGFLLFLVFIGLYYLMWGYIYNPTWWQVVLEMGLYGLASFCFYWFIISSGGKLWASKGDAGTCTHGEKRER
jgi:hypothetical protein